MQVVLPPHLTGRKMSDDPTVQGKYEELWRIEECVRDNKIDMPPEVQRSPSPPPIYDRFGIRQNTRQLRYKDKMLDKRADLIEELIKLDEKYQPPSDYRPRKRHRKINIPYKEYPGYNFIGTPDVRCVPAVCSMPQVLVGCWLWCIRTSHQALKPETAAIGIRLLLCWHCSAPLPAASQHHHHFLTDLCHAGLIIGPRGNTQKRMQMETNTKIAIRGRGSVKEGAARDPKYDYGEDEDLHVLITGDSNVHIRAKCRFECS